VARDMREGRTISGSRMAVLGARVAAASLLVLAFAAGADAGRKEACKTRRCASDVTPPSVVIKTPAGSAVVRGTLTVAGTASDNVGVAKVEVSVDGGPYRLAQGTATWGLALDTTVFADGSHTIVTRASDAAGNRVTAKVSVTSDNVPDDLASPRVALVSPVDGATVSGTLTVAGTASDDVGVAKVEVSVDGGPYRLAQSTGSWSLALDTTVYADGSHTITAKATDAAGRSSTASAGISVSNAPPPAPSPPPPPPPPPSDPSVAERLVTPEGATIEIASDVSGWTAQQVYDLLRANALQFELIGPSLTVKVQTQYASGVTAGASTTDSVYTSFTAIMYLKATANATFTIQPDKVVAHEYGHVWTLYHLYLSRQADWTTYLAARGLAGDARLDSSYAWSKTEIIADDYRLLFGTESAIAQGPQHMNPDIPDPRDVPGLRVFFLNVWTTP
jgi:hypothetical protein